MVGLKLADVSTRLDAFSLFILCISMHDCICVSFGFKSCLCVEMERKQRQNDSGIIKCLKMVLFMYKNVKHVPYFVGRYLYGFKIRLQFYLKKKRIGCID